MQERHTVNNINSLTGLKAIAMLMIFWWHAPLRNLPADMGARMCELLFVCSGFLVGYNFSRRDEGDEPTWRQSFNYFKKKFLQVWPLHAICTMLALIFLSTAPVFNDHTAIQLLFNLSLLQSWLPGYANRFSFNGASWFISSLLFCYFLSPMLCSVTKNRRKSIAILVAICSLRIALELVAIKYPGQFFSFSFHTFPLVRALEFFMGVLLVPLYKTISCKFYKRPSKKTFAVSTLVELACMAAIITAFFAFNSSWIRGYYAAAFLPVVLVLALNGGIISRLLGAKPFLLFAKIQFTFFILHQVVIRLVSRYGIADWAPNNLTKTAFIFGLLLALCIGYYYLSKFIKKLFRSKATRASRSKNRL